MFTGIVQGMGTVADVRRHAGGMRLSVDAGDILGETKHGDSISISGVCLTIAGHANDRLEFDIIQETLNKTTLGALKAGDRVNLEPAMRAGDRFDGHFVQGHVDGTAGVEQVVSTQAEHVIWLRPQAHLLPYLIPKGSVAVDGVSLTVASVDGSGFSVSLIPHTAAETTLGRKRPGAAVNLEVDLIGKYVEKLLQPYAAAGNTGEGMITAALLQENGFI